MEFFDAGLSHSLWIGVIVGAASVVQSLTGFGFALIAISLLPLFMDLQLAVTLVLIIGLTLNMALWWHCRKRFEWSRIMPLVVSGLLTIPVGVVGLHRIPEHLALQMLGVLLVGYVLYSGLQLALPNLESSRWGYAFGAAAGLLTGAFNTGGPPIVIYGNCREWSPEEFRSHLPGVFSVMSIFAIAAHIWQGDVDKTLFTQVGYTLPFVIGGLGLGLGLSKYVKADQFRQVVLLLLGLMGLKLLL